MELAPGTLVGGYRIEAVAGRGGMGIVYRATQLALERSVALKLLTPDLADDDAFRDRFQRESKLLASIDHPNVITVHEAGEHDGRLYIVMRFVVGIDLRELIKREGKLDPARAVHLISQVAAGLDAAHARGLIHRDVKPANVLIESRAGQEHAYLSDFGLTKAVSSTGGGLTGTGQWVGTVDFVAPEQVTGGRVDGRADVYALGCVLFTILTGRVPFDRESEVAKIFAHVNDPPPSARELASELPAGLDAVVRRAMAKEPDERFQSAGEFAGAAGAAVRGEAPLESEPAPARVRAPRPRPRPTARTLALAAAGVAVAAVAAVLLLGGGGSGGGDRGAVTAKRLTLQPIPVDSHPTGVAVADGQAWVANSGADQVTPIDTRSGKPGRPIAVPETPTSVAVLPGSVFVTISDGGAVARIDAGARRLSPRRLRFGDLANGHIAAGEGELWATLNTGDLVRVDPSSGHVLLRRQIPTPGLDGPLAVGGGSVWVVASSEHESYVVRVDRPSGTVVRRIPLGRGSSAAGVAYGEGAAWAADVKHNVVERIDPATNTVVKRIPIPTGVSSDDIAVGGGAVWVASSGDSVVVRIDPATNRLIGGATRVSTSDESGLSVGQGAAWITDPDNDSLTRLGY